jgi:hypothetical protein
MRRRDFSSSPGRRRSGNILTVFAVLLPVLLGMVGLVIDGGLLLAAQRQAQGAADAAAMAAAMAKLYNQGTPQAAANTFITTYNGLPNNPTLNNPPLAGPHQGAPRYFEAIVTHSVNTLFMPVLGVNQGTVTARAVAGYEPVSAGEGIGVLDPRLSSGPGLTVTGGASLVVKGPIMVNNLADPAANVNGGGTIEAAAYRIGGPTVSGPFNPYPGTSGTVNVNQGIMPDPLIDLPTPGGSSAGATNTTNNTATSLSEWSTQSLGSVSSNDLKGLQSPNFVDSKGVVQLYPGVYSSIKITGGQVNFNPGIYILSPQQNTTSTLAISGSSPGDIITGTGVMFYNSGKDYNPSTGSPDYNDASQYDPGPTGYNPPINAPPSSSSFQNNFGGISIDGSKAKITLSPIVNTADPFNEMLIYQRRANTSTVKITGGNLSLTGTLYNKWGQFNISGGGSYQAQFVAGTMQLSGQATITLQYAGNQFGKANQVFLVE